RSQNEIVNAAGSGLIGWISTEDITDIAFRALTDLVIEHTSPIMVGPELLSYANIAQILTDVLGCEIKHRTISAEDHKATFIRWGWPADYAVLMSALDVGISEGAEERIFSRADFVGQQKIQVFVEEHRDAEQWRAV
ncbi:hypothetical protein DFH07DRAFT_749636, partial [Mycena maculata]